MTEHSDYIEEYEPWTLMDAVGFVFGGVVVWTAITVLMIVLKVLYELFGGNT